MSERETSMGRVFCLDLASRVGWAFGPPVDSGVERFLRPATRWVEFSDWLAERLDTLAPDRVVYEAGLMGRGKRIDSNATRVAFGMSTRVEEQAARRGIRCESVHNATLKLWATGSGKASKEEMLAAAVRVWGERLVDFDEGDARCLLALALGRFPVPVVKKRKAGTSVLPRREPGAGG